MLSTSLTLTSMILGSSRCLHLNNLAQIFKSGYLKLEAALLCDNGKDLIYLMQ